jgi:hypothetical protein
MLRRGVSSQRVKLPLADLRLSNNKGENQGDLYLEITTALPEYLLNGLLQVRKLFTICKRRNTLYRKCLVNY